MVVGAWIALAILPSVPQALRATLFAGWILGATGVVTLPYLIIGRLNLMTERELTQEGNRSWFVKGSQVADAVFTTYLGGLVAIFVLQALTPDSDLEKFYEALLITAHLGILYLLRRRVRGIYESAHKQSAS